MKFLPLFIAVLLPATALAQTASTKPPMVGNRPLVQVKPRPAKPAKPAKPQAMAVRLQACLEIEDGSKGRLDCYDAAVKPELSANPPPVKGIRDCRHLIDKNDRLGCFDGFAEQIPKFTH